MPTLTETAARVIGPVEWEDDGDRYRLGRNAGSQAWISQRQNTVAPELWSGHSYLGDHVAACLRRDQADRYLAERGIYLGLAFGCTRGNIKYMVWKVDDLDDPQSNGSPLTTRGWDSDFDLDELVIFPDPDAARCAALESCEKEDNRG